MRFGSMSAEEEEEGEEEEEEREEEEGQREEEEAVVAVEPPRHPLSGQTLQTWNFTLMCPSRTPWTAPLPSSGVTSVTDVPVCDW